MRVISTDIRPEKGCAVTIGAFDGVHLGHQALIQQTRQTAQSLGCSSAVVTFDRHPATIVRPDSAPKLLTDLDQKLELIAATGVDYILVLPFDEGRAQESAENFVTEILISRLGARSVIVGYDFHFGKNRQGNLALLKDMGAQLGFDVEEAKPISDDEAIISSTRIRNALSQGNVEEVTRGLGRAHEVRGLVVIGDGRGRELGYPTANIHLAADIMLPADGIYAGEYVMENSKVYTAAISLGTRPTFHLDGANLLEAYLLDFDGDLYGQRARIRFNRFIRGQQKFDSSDELVAQITQDVAEVQKLANT